MNKQQNEPKIIALRNPFDAHMHWRQKDGLLGTVAKYSIEQFSGGLLMPNTNPKVTDSEKLDWYTREVLEEIGGQKFFPIFTYYLTPDLPLHDLRIAWKNKKIHALKYYPKGGTTGSDKGSDGFQEVMPILSEMQKLGIPLLIHGETPQVKGVVVDDFERERVFMETELIGLTKEFPELNIVLEHITTEAAVRFTLEYANVRATITPQHCMFDRRALFNGSSFLEDSRTWSYDLNKNGMHPSLMCRPILKNEQDVMAIRDGLKLQALRGFKKFGLGTDTAPHTADKKYCECGACGVYSAPIALELYAMAFEEMGILDHLSVFACDVMPEFYGIKDELPKKTILLEPTQQQIPKDYDGIVTPFAGMTIRWTATIVGE